jgi:hypothetical protein
VPVNDITASRGYQKPNSTNTLAYDVSRICAALDAIDADIAAFYGPLDYGFIAGSVTSSSDYGALI